MVFKILILNGINYGSSYSYVITMTVSDCTDSVLLNINTADETTTETISLLVTATAISNDINVNDELRILTEILTDLDSDDVIFEYIWT